MSSKDIHTELLALQETVARQTMDLETLGDEVFRQQKEVTSLKAMVKALKEEIASLRSSRDAGGNDGFDDQDAKGASDFDKDRPPHY